jgi:hypothetical protein
MRGSHIARQPPHPVVSRFSPAASARRRATPPLSRAARARGRKETRSTKLIDRINQIRSGRHARSSSLPCLQKEALPFWKTRSHELEHQNRSRGAFTEVDPAQAKTPADPHPVVSRLSHAAKREDAPRHPSPARRGRGEEKICKPHHRNLQDQTRSGGGSVALHHRARLERGSHPVGTPVAIRRATGVPTTLSRWKRERGSEEKPPRQKSAQWN